MPLLFVIFICFYLKDSYYNKQLNILNGYDENDENDRNGGNGENDENDGNDEGNEYGKDNDKEYDIYK